MARAAVLTVTVNRPGKPAFGSMAKATMAPLLPVDTFRNRLQRLVKPELNKLYTEPPKLESGDGDWGWFCKEHAFHTYFIAKLFGFASSIRRGEFVGRNPLNLSYGFDGISSVDSDSDHVWCQIEEIVPVDLSANFEFFGGGFPWIDLVFGPSEQTEPVVLYFSSSEAFAAHAESTVSRSVLAYLETQTVTIEDRALLSDPYLLLVKPRTGGLGDTYGHDIFNKVTLHLFDVARGSAERLLTKGRNFAEALGVIRNRYPNATDNLFELLKLDQDGSGN